MAELSAEAIIEGGIDEVWALLADFGRIEAWWPAGAIERVVNEGEGVGMIRHIYNKGAKGPVSERLDLLDPVSKVLILSVVGKRPGGMTAYVATCRLTALGPGRCRIDYRSHVTAEAGREQIVEGFLYQAYGMMFDGLNAAVKRPPAH